MNRLVTTAAASALAFASLVAAAPVAGAATGPSTTAAPRCDEGHWPASVQGQPVSFSAGARSGYYVWHDGDGWHLRTTTPSTESHRFAGKITASDNIKVVRVFKNEANDFVKVSGRTVTFRFDTHNHVDGFDFKVGCAAGPEAASVKFSLTCGKFRGTVGRWPNERIWLGATGTARTNPFTVSRIPAA